MRRWLCGLALLAGFSSTALANEGLKGRWEGVYTCNAQRDSAMILTINRVEKGRLAGIFEFQAGPDRGSYSVAGSFDARGTFQLGPDKWIKQPAGFRAIGFDGRLVGGAIEGTSPQCSPVGRFRAALAGAGPASKTAPTPGAVPTEPLSPKEAELVEAFRARIAGMVQSRENAPHKWNILFNEIVFARVNSATQKMLVAEFDMAQAEVQAVALLDELSSGPAEMSEGGVGRVLWVVDRARASKWPEEVVARVRNAGQARVAEVMRPELQAAAALAADLPASLDGLRKARAALLPVEDYRLSLERAFGTVDPEGVLEPLWLRIAVIESDPAVVDALRAALAEARLAKDPRLATEELLFQVLGPTPSATKMAYLVPEAREMAAIAAIAVEDHSPGMSDPLEPTANDIAGFAYKRVVEGNARMAAQQARCRTGQFTDPVSAILCLPNLTVGEMGGLEARLTRIVKKGCVVETPGRQFRCSFLQDVEIFFPAGGPLAPDIVDGFVGKIIRGGYPGDVVDARFLRNGTTGTAEWTVTWGDLQ